MSMRNFKIGWGWKVRREARGQKGHVRPTIIIKGVAVAQHGLWRHTNRNLHTNERVKRSIFFSFRRGNYEQSIARRCLDGAVVWCPCFFMVLFWVITSVVVWWGWLWSMEVLRWKSNTVWWRLVTMTRAAGTKSLVCDDWVPKNSITP